MWNSGKLDNESTMIEVLSFAYYILMLAIGLKIIHAFYSHFKKKKKGGTEGARKNSLSLFDSPGDPSDSDPEKRRPEA
jgi:hypothetical protein